MTHICLYLCDLRVLEIETQSESSLNANEFEDSQNLISKTSGLAFRETYELVHQIISNWLQTYSKFYINFSLSASLLEEIWRDATGWPSFEEVKGNPRIDFLAQVYAPPSSTSYSWQEFTDQVAKYLNLLAAVTSRQASLFHSKHFYFNNQMAKQLGKLGLIGLVSSHADLANMWQHPDFVYQSRSYPLKILIQNQVFSDELARLTHLNGPETVETFIKNLEDSGEVVNLFLDYDQVLEGLDFLEELMLALTNSRQVQLTLASRIVRQQEAVGQLDAVKFSSRKLNSRILTSPLDVFFLENSKDAP